MADDDRNESFGDAFGEGESRDADRWPTNEEGPQGELTSPPQGKSKTVKILLIVLAVLVLGAVLCCGAGIWWYSQNVERTLDAETIREWTREIVAIEVPNRFLPMVGAKISMFNVMSATTVVYDTPGGGSLQITELRGQAVNDPQSQAMLNEQMRQQATLNTIDVTESETRTIDIDGQPAEFTFSTGTERGSGDEWKEVTGNFPSKSGIASFRLQQPTASFDEDEVTDILESIRTE